MDAVYYWLGFIVFWIWVASFAYLAICSLIAELIEWMETRDQ